MPFLIIGGHAINVYGISRQTGDLDLMVPLRAKPLWLELMKKLRYQEGQSDQRFSRFRAVQLDNWPIDLMYVDDKTFESIYKDSIQSDFGPTLARVISAAHLLILKLHALKYYQEHRFTKDYSDLRALMIKLDENVEGEEFKGKCLKYASPQLYERILLDITHQKKQKVPV